MIVHPSTCVQRGTYEKTDTHVKKYAVLLQKKLHYGIVTVNGTLSQPLLRWSTISAYLSNAPVPWIQASLYH